MHHTSVLTLPSPGVQKWSTLFCPLQCLIFILIKTGLCSKEHFQPLLLYRWGTEKHRAISVWFAGVCWVQNSHSPTIAQSTTSVMLTGIKHKLQAVAHSLSRGLNYLSVVENSDLCFFFSIFLVCQLDFKKCCSSFCWTKCIYLTYSSKLCYWISNICFTSDYGSHWCSSNTEFFLFAVFVLFLLWHWGSLHKLDIIIF